MPGISKIAYAYGFEYCKIETNDNLSSNLRSALLWDNKPTICEVVLDPSQTCYPKTALRVDANGNKKQMPLEDLYPFLPRDEFKKLMIVRLHPNSDYE